MDQLKIIGHPLAMLALLAEHRGRALPISDDDVFGSLVHERQRCRRLTLGVTVHWTINVYERTHHCKLADCHTIRR